MEYVNVEKDKGLGWGVDVFFEELQNGGGVEDWYYYRDGCNFYLEYYLLVQYYWSFYQY